MKLKMNVARAYKSPYEAVPPPFAAALVRANLPEWCGGVEVSTMAELERMVAV